MSKDNSNNEIIVNDAQTLIITKNNDDYKDLLELIQSLEISCKQIQENGINETIREGIRLSIQNYKNVSTKLVKKNAILCVRSNENSILKLCQSHGKRGIGSYVFLRFLLGKKVEDLGSIEEESILTISDEALTLVQSMALLEISSSSSADVIYPSIGCIASYDSVETFAIGKTYGAKKKECTGMMSRFNTKYKELGYRAMIVVAVYENEEDALTMEKEMDAHFTPRNYISKCILIYSTIFF